MNVKFADNINLRMIDALNSVLPHAQRAQMAVAFVKSSGMELLEPLLNACLAEGGNIEFIVGLDFHTTDAESLQMMYELTTMHPSKFRFYCYSDPTDAAATYHPKLYLFERNESVTGIIGSSNLTRGGLSENIEINAVLEFTSQDQEGEALKDIYARIKYQPTRFSPDIDYIQAYAEIIRRGAVSHGVARDKSPQHALAAIRQREQSLPKPFVSPDTLQRWQKLVFSKLPNTIFQTSELYQYIDEFSPIYPNNQHIEAKIRQILQQLRDLGIITSLGEGRWIKIDIMGNAPINE